MARELSVLRFQRKLTSMQAPTATVISVYMSNINMAVVHHQERCVTRMLPKDWTFRQYLQPSDVAFPHAAGMQTCLDESDNNIVIFLDIDCIPLTRTALPYLAYSAWCGALAGALQRANHINNGGHLYVGPFCMALSRDKYEALGSPTFQETERGDVGEELTYAWEADNPSLLHTLRPTDVEVPLWKLEGERRFGYGTTYQDLFYHSFCIRDHSQQERFIQKCREVLNPKQAAA